MNKQLRALLFTVAVFCLFLMSLSFLFFPFFTSAGYIRTGPLVAGFLLLFIGAGGGYGLLYYLNRSRQEYLAYQNKPITYRSPFSTFSRNEYARRVDKALPFALGLLILVMLISRTSFFTWFVLSVVVALINAHIIFNGEVAPYCGLKFPPVQENKPPKKPVRKNSGAGKKPVSRNAPQKRKAPTSTPSSGNRSAPVKRPAAQRRPSQSVAKRPAPHQNAGRPAPRKTATRRVQNNSKNTPR